MLLFLLVPSCNVTNCRTFFSNICNFFFTLFYIIITPLYRWNLLQFLFRAVNSNQVILSFLLKCFPWIFSFTLFGSLVFNFSLLWCESQDPAFPCFLHSSFSWSNFREGSYYFRGHFHKPNWCSFFSVVLGVWRCNDWFCYLTVRSVSDTGG